MYFLRLLSIVARLFILVTVLACSSRRLAQLQRLLFGLLPTAPSNYVAGSEHTVGEADLDPPDQQVPCVQSFHNSSQLTPS